MPSSVSSSVFLGGGRRQPTTVLMAKLWRELCAAHKHMATSCVVQVKTVAACGLVVAILGVTFNAARTQPATSQYFATAAVTRAPVAGSMGVCVFMLSDDMHQCEDGLAHGCRQHWLGYSSTAVGYPPTAIGFFSSAVQLCAEIMRRLLDGPSYVF